MVDPTARILQRFIEALLDRHRTRARDQLARLDGELQAGRLPSPADVLEVLSDCAPSKTINP